MKSYADIEQSKKLAEILPIESADNVIVSFGSREGTTTLVMPKETLDVIRTPFSDIREVIPCWSLAALLDVLPKKYYPIKEHETNLIIGKPKDKWCVLYWDTTGMQHGEETLGDNPIDACYEMIIKLNELKML